jgi:hypothetical protein
MISRFPDLNQYVLGTEPTGIADWFEVLLAIVTMLLAIGFLLWLRKWPPQAWPQRFFVGFLMLLCLSATFGFVYHLTFRSNPENFSISDEINISNAFVPIGKQQKLLDKLEEHRQLLAYTLAGLASADGEQRLRVLAKDISGEVRSAYLASLSLAIVSSPQVSTSDQMEAVALLRQETPKEVRENIEAEREVAKDESGILSPIPGLDAAMELPLEQTVNMQVLLKAILGGKRPVISNVKRLDAYADAENSERLRKYLLNDLHLSMRSNDTVDLKKASDQLSVYEILTNSAIKVAAGDWKRIVDFQYFSLTMITLVGFGDMLPNSTLTRFLVCVEVLCGTAFLGFVLDRLLHGPGTREK